MGANTEAIAAVQFVTRYAVRHDRIELHGDNFATADIVPACFAMSSAINNVLFAIRDQANRSPYRLYHDSSLILNFFETNNIIGWNAANSARTIQVMQYLCSEHVASTTGVSMAFLSHVHRILDMLYQTRIFMSLYYHQQDA